MTVPVDQKRRIAMKLFWVVAAIAVGSLVAGILDINDLAPRQQSDGWRNYWIGLGIGIVAAACAWAYLLMRPVEKTSDDTISLRVVQLIPLLGALGIFLETQMEETTWGVALMAGLGGWLLVSLAGLRLDWKRRKIFRQAASTASGSGHG